MPFRGLPRNYPRNDFTTTKSKSTNATTRPRLPRKRLQYHHRISRVKTIKLRGTPINRRQLYRFKRKRPRQRQNRVLATNGIRVRRVINTFRVLSIHGKRNPRTNQHHRQSSKTMLQLNNTIRRNNRLFKPRKSLRVLRHVRPRHLMNMNKHINRGNRQYPRPTLPRLHHHLRAYHQIYHYRLSRMRLGPTTHVLFPRRYPHILRLFRSTNINPTNVVFGTIPLRPPPRRHVQTTSHGIGSRFFGSFLLPNLPNTYVLHHAKM